MASTNALTARLKREYPPRTVIEFDDRFWQRRTGLVETARRGLVVVRSPARTARMPKKTWGVTEVTPHRHYVPEERIVRVLRKARAKKEVE